MPAIERYAFPGSRIRIAVFALGLLAGVAFQEQARADGGMIQVSCSVISGASHLPAGFAGGFCEKLVEALRAQLDGQFAVASKGQWAQGASVVDVGLDVTSPNRARVSISTGKADAGGLEISSTVESSLKSFDSELQPHAANALVRGIGIQLGLVDG